MLPYICRDFCCRNSSSLWNERSGLVTAKIEHADMTYRCQFLLRFPLLPLFLVLLSVGAQAATETVPTSVMHNRLAIVIGNTDYKSTRIEDLPNARNDATKLADSLKRLNFDVLLGTDLSTNGFEELFRQADARLPTVSAVLIFYSGHGFQLQGQNYLLPTDASDPESLEKVMGRVIKLNDVIARFSSRDRQTFVFLDACRDNPLGSGTNAPAGLAQVEVGENAFIAFATQPGNVAVDGVGDNSPFTQALIDSIELPGLSISDMMIRVRNETEKQTLGRQVPWDQSNLREQFYFTEQQVLDPVQLSTSLSLILADPIAKQKLQAELASNDLQTAVVLVGKTMRSVAVSPPSTAPSQPSATQLASLSGTEGIESARKSAVSGIETLIDTSAAQQGEDKAKDLARSIQTELRRVGCYRSVVDGDWGKGSERALTDYYKNTNQQVASTGPTVQLLSDLFLRSGRICKQPVVIKKVKAAVLADDSEGSNSATAGKGKKPGKRASRPAAAPPPDISGGIGIGGVF
ncbi:caspase family protein [Mesorhizobium sp. BAC0120]|uniref:caspase family protein n=1 Tax=Mesorhizobium sp. BAC0120 TaxID=3090670 RepID=UPI00298CAA72|nr:caspase family protein [Mesorhizobium sp. BAC0120]MDW6024110.1 caspase family protein [Mesorhizobium sp. BAC0120]